MDTLSFGPARPTKVVLFAAGAGGDPQRYRPLLEQFAARGLAVVAPYFERLSGPEPHRDELLARPHGLIRALKQHTTPDLPVVAIGHSIGGWAAVCLAGGRPVGRDGQELIVPREPRIDRLVLYTPAAGWFAGPASLAEVRAEMLVYAAEFDDVTPPEEIAVLQNAPVAVDMRVVPNAGHFSFIHTPPPGVTERGGFDRNAMLNDIADETINFVNR